VSDDSIERGDFLVVIVWETNAYVRLRLCSSESGSVRIRLKNPGEEQDRPAHNSGGEQSPTGIYQDLTGINPSPTEMQNR
jgi:hypothetical protein